MDAKGLLRATRSARRRPNGPSYRVLHNPLVGAVHRDGQREYESREMRGDDCNVDALPFRAGWKRYPALAGAHKAERGARYCSAHGESQCAVVYTARRLGENSRVARNADV